MEKNLVRKSFFFNKILLRKTTRLTNFKTIRKTISFSGKRKKLIRKKKIDKLYILLRPNNTFVTLVLDKKLHNITAGSSGFQGPKRSSPYSRHVVARNMSYFIYRNKLKEPIDLCFNSMITRKFFFFFKGLVIKPFEVRMIIKNKMRAHGKLRAKKKRRK